MRMSLQHHYMLDMEKERGQTSLSKFYDFFFFFFFGGGGGVGGGGGA